MSYEEQPTNRLDAIDHVRKRQQKINESLDWRNSKDNRIEDFDSNFKMLRDLRFGKNKKSQANHEEENNNRIYMASLPKRFTKGTSNSIGQGKIHTASLPQGLEKEWIPGLCAAWSDDCDSKMVQEYNNRIIANHVNRRRGGSSYQ